MKKVDSPSRVTEHIAGVRLTRSDIELIIEIMRREGLVVTVCDEHFEYESLDELIQNRGTRPGTLRVCARIPNEALAKVGAPDYMYESVNVECERSAVLLRGPRSAVVYELRQVLASKACVRHRVLSPSVWGLMLFVYCWCLFAIGSLHKGWLDLTGEWLVYVGFAIVVLFGVSVMSNRYTLGVRLRRTHEGGFWQRNLDKTLLLLIGAVLGIVTTVISQYLRER